MVVPRAKAAVPAVEQLKCAGLHGKEFLVSRFGKAANCPALRLVKHHVLDEGLEILEQSRTTHELRRRP